MIVKPMTSVGFKAEAAGDNSCLPDFPQVSLPFLFVPGVGIFTRIDFNQVSSDCLTGFDLVFQGINKNTDLYSGLFIS